MTKVEGSMIRYIHPPYHGSYNIYYIAWADYVSGSVSGTLNFEYARLVLLCIAAAF